MAASTGSPGAYRHGTTEWPTPQWLVDQLAEEFAPGGFDLDPAAAPGNAKAPRYFTATVDGLSQPWRARAVWLNPPYGKASTPLWLAKARCEVDLGHAALVVCLVPARVSTRWWRECEADPAVFVRVIGRIRWAADQRGEAPFDSAVIVFGERRGRHGRWPSTCANPACPRPYRRFWPAQRNRKTCSDRCRQAAWRSQARG
jgi:site-specific DNA-methyltransferase (adenine-specific)